MYQSRKYYWGFVVMVLVACIGLSGCGNAAPTPMLSTATATTTSTETTQPTMVQVQPEKTEPSFTSETQPSTTVPIVTEHVHSHIPMVTEPSCEEAGYTLYSCVCGDSYTSDELSALGHSYSKQTIEPTYKAEGYDLYTCNRCGVSYQDNEVPRLSDGGGNAETPKVPEPTETTSEKPEAEDTTSDNPEPECEHVFFSRFVPATQYQEGCALHSCYRCGYTYRTNIKEMLPGGNLPPEGEDCSTGWHTYDDLYSKVIQSSTCAVPGIRVYDCVYCDQQESREMELSDVHVLSSSEAYYKTYYRARCCCGMWFYSDESPEVALQYALTDIEIHNANKDVYGYHEHYLEKGPTEIEELIGPRTYVCMECGETVTDRNMHMNYTRVSD